LPIATKLVDHDLKALLEATMDNERGAVKLSIKKRPKNVYTGEGVESHTLTGSFVLSRKTNQNDTWQEIKRFSLN
jgi:hypothetical protein